MVAEIRAIGTRLMSLAGSMFARGEARHPVRQTVELADFNATAIAYTIAILGKPDGKNSEAAI